MLVVLFQFKLLIVEVLRAKDVSSENEPALQDLCLLTFTASKLINESTATVAALLSALLASRRILILDGVEKISMLHIQ